MSLLCSNKHKQQIFEVLKSYHLSFVLAIFNQTQSFFFLFQHSSLKDVFVENFNSKIHLLFVSLYLLHNSTMTLFKTKPGQTKDSYFQQKYYSAKNIYISIRKTYLTLKYPRSNCYLKFLFEIFSPTKTFYLLYFYKLQLKKVHSFF